MKNITLLPCLILVISMFSCKKGNDAPASTAALPKTYTEDVRSSVVNSLVTYNVTYDSKGRLISLAATPEPSVIKFVYQYPDDKTITMDLYNYSQLSIHEKFWLNSFSLVDSTFQYDDSQDTSTEKYFYDPNHLVKTVNNYDYSGGVSTLSNQTQYTYDNNGNALTQSDNTGTISFTYYMDKPYNLTMGLTFVAGPKYFIKTTTSDASGSPITATHYYKFDSSNRLIQDSSYVSGVDAIAIKSYTY
jgi:YD repeat-containing protein